MSVLPACLYVHTCCDHGCQKAVVRSPETRGMDGGESPSGYCCQALVIPVLGGRDRRTSGAQVLSNLP